MANTIIVFDYETDSVKAGTDECNPVELAAVAIHSRDLKIIKGSEFSINLRPVDIDEEDYYERHKSTIDWHCKQRNINLEDLLAEWRNGQCPKLGHKQFLDYCEQYNYAGKWWSKPMAGGTNIRDFDLKVLDHQLSRYKLKPPFLKRDVVDVLDLCNYWFMFLPSHLKPRSYKMDELRPWFGMASENSHVAAQDVIDEATIIIKFLKQFKKYAPAARF